MVVVGGGGDGIKDKCERLLFLSLLLCVCVCVCVVSLFVWLYEYVLVSIRCLFNNSFISSHLSLNREGRLGNINDFATSFPNFPCSPLPSWTWRTPGLSIPWCCLPTSSSVCLGFFPLLLCLAKWFWPDLMNMDADRPYHTKYYQHKAPYRLTLSKKSER